MSASAAHDTARLFFALWPPADTRGALAAHAEGWQWPPAAARVATENLHVTLHFLGDVERRRLPALLQIEVPLASFVLHFGTTELWPHGIAVLRPSATPPALSRLHAALAESIRAIGLATDRRSYRPHVTLARRAAAAVMPHHQAPITWAIDRFSLVESVPGARAVYKVLAEYALVRRSVDSERKGEKN